MSLISKTVAIGFAALMLMATPASAATIYDNGGPLNGPSASGNEATLWVQAEDFSLAGGGSVGGAGVYIAGLGDLGNWDGTVEYFFFADAGGSPGALLTAGKGQGITTTDTGLSWCCGGNSFLLEFTLESVFSALAGMDYWFGIHLSTNFDRDEIYWVRTSFNSTTPGHESSGGTFDNWSNSSLEHAFFLTGPAATVPEPGAIVLVAFGLLGVALMRRRRMG